MKAVATTFWWISLGTPKRKSMQDELAIKHQFLPFCHCNKDMNISETTGKKTSSHIFLYLAPLPAPDCRSLGALFCLSNRCWSVRLRTCRSKHGDCWSQNECISSGVKKLRAMFSMGTFQILTLHESLEPLHHISLPKYLLYLGFGRFISGPPKSVMFKKLGFPPPKKRVNV